MEVTPHEEPNKPTRRGFLKLAAGVAGSLFLNSDRFGKIAQASPLPESVNPNELFPSPTNIHGVEVYGLQNSIKTQRQIEKLYDYFDEKFASENSLSPDELKNKLTCRKEHLNPNERYLEVVVRKSAYDTFLQKKPDTGVDFVEWIKIHIDILNRSMENAKPPVSIKAILRRIVLIEDTLSAGWDESSWKKGTKGNIALDWWWAMKFRNRYPVDIDASWAIATDYRGDKTKKPEAGSFWSFKTDPDSKVTFRFPPEGEQIDQTYTLPIEEDSLSGKDNIWVDFALIHEWTHYLLNLPDVYNFNIENAPFKFRQFSLQGDYMQPELSPYLSMLLTDHIKKGVRNPWVEGLHKGYSYEETPITMNIYLREKGKPIIGKISLYASTQENKTSTGNKYFINKPNTEVDQTDNCPVPSHPFKADANLLYITASNNDQIREVYIPAAAFNMTKMAGVENADYYINFTGHKNPYATVQTIHQVDESDLVKFLSGYPKDKQAVYAAMKVAGTSTYFVWTIPA